MNVNYQLNDNAETGEITLRVTSIDSAFFDKIISEGTLTFGNSSYAVNICRSGSNILESNMGVTMLYVSEDGFQEQEVTLEGYVTQDRNVYQDRVNNVMQMVNAAA